MQFVDIHISISEKYAKEFTTTKEMENAFKYFLDSYIETKQEEKLKVDIKKDKELDKILSSIDKKL